METSLDKQCTGHPQSTPNCVGHPHAESMKLYAEDAMTTSEPWKLWEFFYSGGWHDCIYHPAQDQKKQYRRKPRTININGFEVPSPLRNPPNDGEICYIVNLTENRAYCVIWCNTTSFYTQWLKSGIVHSTKEAAELHLKALLSFTQQH